MPSFRGIDYQLGPSANSTVMILPIIIYVSGEVDCKLYLITTINSLSQTFEIQVSDSIRSCLSSSLGRPYGKVREMPLLAIFPVYRWPRTSLAFGLLSVSPRSARFLGHTVLPAWGG